MTTDASIRNALHKKKLLKAHSCKDTLVIDELGLSHARARIDVATINGCIHGYEIKSEADTLSRLPAQLKIYQESLQKLTIVCAEKHLQKTLRVSPDWAGVVVASEGKMGAVNFKTIRRAKNNPRVSGFALAHLLWRSEAFEIASDTLDKPIKKYATRNQIYELLAAHLTVPQLTTLIKAAMVSRAGWRDHKTLLSCGD